MAKMYYTEQEAADKLGISASDLLDKVRTGDLHAYADGANKMFKVTEVDQLADSLIVDSGESDIQLSPVEMSGTHAPLSLADTADATSISESIDTKHDTVMTSEGISIFDDEELELEEADPMAKTQIAPSLEEGMGLEGLSSGGSGLLDLTREDDDTSIGSAVLDHIDMESGEMPSVEGVDEGIGEGIGEELDAAPAPAPAMQMVEATPMYDPSSTMFTGMAVAGTLVSLLLVVVGMSMMLDTTPSYVAAMGTKIPIIAGSAFGLFIIAAIIGHVVGKRDVAGQG